MIHLVDASVYVFRAYFSIPDTMTDRDGAPVNALFGFCAFIGDFLEAEQPEHLAVAFDASLTSSFRNEIYADYKANRELPPPELKHQFALCREFARALGLAEFIAEDYEADDIIGTIVTAMRSYGRRSVIVTRDKDLTQLLRDGDEYWDYAAGKRLSYGDIEGIFGVRPEQIADYLALAGDSVDNIPGVRGVGRKSAAALLRHFESLEELYQNLDEVAQLELRGAARLAEKLRAQRDMAFLSRRLTRIACDMPISLELDTLRRRRPDLDALFALYDSVDFGTRLRRQAQRIAGRFQPHAA